MAGRPKVVPEGARWCNGCKRTKPLDAFHRNRSEVGGREYYCGSCHRIGQRAYETSDRGLAARRAYRDRPGVREREREREARPEARAAKRAADRRYLAKPTTRLLRQRQDVRRELRAARTDRSRRHWEARLAQADAELARAGWEPRPLRKAAS